MKPTLHTILSRDDSPITLDEWRAALERLDSFTITNNIKQQNPFTKEFTHFDSPGGGYWKSPSINGPVWSDDGAIWFRFGEGSVLATQFSNLDDPELVSLAESLVASVRHHQIGA